VLLSRAREKASSERVWLKSALLEREAGQPKEALALLQQAMVRYTSAKYYLMAGQVLEQMGEAVKARGMCYKPFIGTMMSINPVLSVILYKNLSDTMLYEPSHLTILYTPTTIRSVSAGPEGGPQRAPVATADPPRGEVCDPIHTINPIFSHYYL
jgi:hypothetical protein